MIGRTTWTPGSPSGPNFWREAPTGGMARSFWRMGPRSFMAKCGPKQETEGW